MPTHDPLPFPDVDPVGPAVAGLAIAGREVLSAVVAPGAAHADAAGVPRATLDALARPDCWGRP